MGTNIYCFVEYKPHNEYEAYCELFLSRDYELFALLADVQYESEIMKGIEPIAEPKGLPSDVSRKAKIAHSKVDGFAESFLYIDELEEVHRRYLRIPSITDDADNMPTTEYGELITIINMMTMLESFTEEKSRLVFWFV